MTWRQLVDGSILTRPGFALALLLGVVGAQLLPASAFPAREWLLGLGCLTLMAAFWSALPVALRLVCWCGFGLLLGIADAQTYLSQRWPVTRDGEDHRLTVQVNSMPVPMDEGIRFDVRVLNAIDSAAPARDRKLRISWYEKDVRVLPGDVLDATMRLRSPRGSLNPGGFDFERYTATRDVHALGYVRNLHARVYAPVPVHARLLRWRMAVSERISAAVKNPSIAPLLQALSVGDQRQLKDADWEIMRATGIGHLISISGLHLGLLAGFGVLLTRAMYRRRPQWGLRLVRPVAESMVALGLALAYSAAAGFEIPVLRALLMIFAILMARLTWRSVSPWSGLSVALTVLLIFDPRMVLSASFWLTFGGVFWLAFVVEQVDTHWRAAAWHLLRLQLWMSLAMLPFGIWFFSQTSVVGPLANLIAIPWVNLVIVPLALLALLVGMVSIPLSAALFALAAALLQPLWTLLQHMARWPMAEWYFPQVPWPLLLLAILALMVFARWRLWPSRWAALLLLLPLFGWQAATLRAGEFELLQMDVGQGNALLIRTQTHALAYDAGPKFRGGLDSGETVVVPALRAMGVRELHALVISHSDNDHAGGAAAVRSAFRPYLRFLGEREDFLRCEAGTHWTWDGVRFEFLHPPKYFPDLGNDSSCVLRIENGKHALLLPGDVSELIEARLIESHAKQLRSTVLLVPHHGSRTASSAAFLDAVKPEVALVSAGWRSRFGHPAPEVMQRYLERRIKVLEIAVEGAVRAKFPPQGAIEWQAGERRARKTWWTQASDVPETTP